MDTYIFLVIALILMYTKGMSLFMRRLHLPQVVGAVLAGILLGPPVFGVIAPSETLELLAEFGVILLLFSAGMETDFNQLRKNLKSSFIISFLGVAVTLGAGFGVAYWFGKSPVESFFIGVVIASVSTGIIVEALHELGKLKSKTGTILLSVSLFDDIIVIGILAVAMGGAQGEFSLYSLGMTLAKMVGFFGFAILGGLFMNKLYNSIYEKFGRTKRLSVFAVAYCFLMVYLAEWLGLANIIGAYIAGIAFCNTKCVEYLETKTNVLSYMLFTPIFLANIGLKASFDSMDTNAILFTVFFVLAAVVSKFLGCGLGAKICGFTSRESFQVGAGMIARGEVSFVVASKVTAVGLISPDIFLSVIIVSLSTILITPMLLQLAYKEKRKEKSTQKQQST
ncbi:MAG: cation:proton antiporter [Oscillospiraceae bacterium]|nr:cation:proton antiporter [Oscillospiraceae bacterium]